MWAEHRMTRTAFIYVLCTSSNIKSLLTSDRLHTSSLTAHTNDADVTGGCVTTMHSSCSSLTVPGICHSVVIASSKAFLHTNL